MSFMLSDIPLLWLYLIAFGFGVIIGSFLNVCIYRFHTGKSLAGNSHCLSCGTQLCWYELFPLLSYAFLRGRCRSCGSYIPIRYFAVELLTGILFAVTIMVTLNLYQILLLWLICALLVFILVYDINHFIVPDALTITVTIAVFSYGGYRVVMGYPAEQFGSDILAAVLGASFYFFLWFISKGTWLGFGDVKLAFPLGLLVGASKVFSFVVLSFWIGAAISLLIIGYGKLKRGKNSLQLGRANLTMKSAIPFAPFLIASCLLIVFLHIDVLTFFQFYI